MNGPEEGLERVVLVLRPDADPIAGWIDTHGKSEPRSTGSLRSLLERVGGS